MDENMNDPLPEESTVPQGQEVAYEDEWDEEWGEYEEPESDDDAGEDDGDPELDLPV